MAVSRISKAGILKMLKGNVSVSSDTLCVIKFYSNGCHLCHALSQYYQEISDSYENVLFYAFNVDDDDEVPSRFNLNGVPSISMMSVKKGKKAKTKHLPDPENPNSETWFTVGEIKRFIDKGVK